jgi:hypothetical protein
MTVPTLSSVMAVLVTAIRVFSEGAVKTWITGTSPVMTKTGRRRTDER